jgi:hypothetical protein
MRDTPDAAGGGVLLTRSPMALGFGVAGCLVGLVLLQQALLGRVPFGHAGTWKDLRIAIVHCLLLGYSPAAAAAVAQGTARTCALLRSHLSPDAEADSLRGQEGRIFTPGLWIAGALGMALAVVGPALTEPGRTIGSWWHPTGWPPEVWWHRVLGLAVGFGFGALTWLLLASSARLSRLSARVRIDLFDLSPLAPLTRQGLANGLAAVGPLALYGLIAVDFGLTPMFAVMAVTALTMVTATLVLPLRGAYRQIRAARTAELDWCAASIENERRAVRDERAAGAGGRFADLLAYETLVRRVPEWPFDPGTLTRVALYSIIPLGSWVASTLVQHAIERYVFRR